MKLLFKILFFVLAIFYTNISEVKAFVFIESVSEINFAFNQTENKNESTVILENDLSISCKSESSIVDYRNLAVGVMAKAAKGGSILADASKAAYSAADDVGSIFIKNKHLSSATGNYAKFATTEISTAQGWVQQALRSPNARFLPNPQIPNTFQVVTDLGTKIGTKGQTSIRAIVGFDGKVINAFPVK